MKNKKSDFNKEDQINNIAKFICNACEMGDGFEGNCIEGNDYRICGISKETARAIYNEGYRKIEK